jgi:hypothetical protein
MELLRTKEAAKFLAISPWKLRNLAKEVKIPYISEGDATSPLRFLRTDLEKYVMEHRFPKEP